jgi:hypothetical protein
MPRLRLERLLRASINVNRQSLSPTGITFRPAVLTLGTRRSFGIVPSFTEIRASMVDGVTGVVGALDDLRQLKNRRSEYIVLSSILLFNMCNVRTVLWQN